MKYIKQIIGMTWKGLKTIISWYVHLFKGRPWYVKILSGGVSLIVAILLYLGAVDINFF